MDKRDKYLLEKANKTENSLLLDNILKMKQV